jgi:hypothetical protein
MRATSSPASGFRSSPLRALVVLLTIASRAPVLAAGDAPLLTLPSPVGELRYTPGRGLRVGDTGLTLGGYANLNVSRDEGGPGNFSIDDLSLFVSWDPTERLHFFSELEVEDLVDVADNGERTAPTLTAERLYGDFTLSDGLSARVGKFLTPVGRWNVLHAQPLVWTTSRPLVTELPFDPHTTGAMLFGSLFPSRGTLTWSLYGQFDGQLDRLPSPQEAERSGGARLEYAPGPAWSVGGSYLAFRAAEDGGWRHLTGVDTLWRHGPYEVMGEVAAVEPRTGDGKQWGLYLQGVRETVPHLFVVVRYEHMERPASFAPVNIGVLGLAWKPVPYVVVKGEYLFADHRADESPPGVKMSLAILF